MAPLPYSDNCLMQVFLWGLERTDHETLDNSDPNNLIEVQTMFLGLSKNQRFDETLLRKNKLSGYLKVPMSVEGFAVPDALKAAFGEMFNNFAGIGNEANLTANAAFIAELRKHKELLYVFPDKA